jgi:hypothetical protein
MFIQIVFFYLFIYYYFSCLEWHHHGTDGLLCLKNRERIKICVHGQKKRGEKQGSKRICSHDNDHVVLLLLLQDPFEVSLRHNHCN